MLDPLTPRTPTSPHPDPATLTNAIELALATSPLVEIPANFATRITALAVAQHSPQLTVGLPSPRYARAALLLCTLAILIPLLSLTPSLLARHPSQTLTFTWLLCAEAVLLAAALGPWRALWTSPV